MAYLNQDEEETKGQGLNQALGQPQGTAKSSEPQQPESQGQSSAPATISANTAQPSAPMPQQKQQKAGTGTFTNLRNYLQANQGNRVASAASQRVGNVASGAQKGVEQAQNVFGQRVEQGSIKGFQGARQEAQGIVQVGTQAKYQPAQQPAQETPQQAPAAPAQPSVFSEDQKQRFAEILNAQYKGPQSLQEAGLYEPAAQKVQTAAQAGKQTQTAAGRENLLRDIYGRNRDYTRGQNKLDSLLLNTSEAGVRGLQEQGARAAATQGLLDTAQNMSSNMAQQRTADTQALRQGVREDFTGAQKGLETGVNQRIEAMTTAVAKDEAGNPIVKRDAAGNEIKDAQGNPVYMSEWERLPAYFQDLIRNREATNKATQERELANLNANAAYKEAVGGQLQSRLAENQKQLRLLQTQRDMMNAGPIIGGMDGASQYTTAVDPQQKADIEARIAQLSAGINADTALANEYASKKGEITGRNLKNLNLTAEEAAMLGLGSGAGVYNLNADAIQTAAADKTKLISKDELTRLQALSQLAGMDQDRALKTQILGGDAYDISKAGTQSALDALDRAATQKQFQAAEQQFREQAQGQNITGYGAKKNKTSGKKYYAEETANLGDVLKRAGYDFESQSPELASREAILRNISGSRSSDQDQEGLIDAAVSPFTDNSNIVNKLINTNGTIALLRGLGVDVGGAVSKLFGGGANSKESKADAARFAREDLQRKTQQAIEQSGFLNRAGIVDNKESQARMEALRRILATRDKTNA